MSPSFVYEHVLTDTELSVQDIRPILHSLMIRMASITYAAEGTWTLTQDGLSSILQHCDFDYGKLLDVDVVAYAALKPFGLRDEQQPLPDVEKAWAVYDHAQPVDFARNIASYLVDGLKRNCPLILVTYQTTIYESFDILVNAIRERQVELGIKMADVYVYDRLENAYLPHPGYAISR